MIDYYAFMEGALNMFFVLLPYIMLCIGIRAFFIFSFKRNRRT